MSVKGLLCEKCGRWTSGRYGAICVFCIDYSDLVEHSHLEAKERPELYENPTANWSADFIVYGDLSAAVIE